MQIRNRPYFLCMSVFFFFFFTSIISTRMTPITSSRIQNLIAYELRWNVANSNIFSDWIFQQKKAQRRFRLFLSIYDESKFIEKNHGSSIFLLNSSIANYSNKSSFGLWKKETKSLWKCGKSCREFKECRTVKNQSSMYGNEQQEERIWTMKNRRLNILSRSVVKIRWNRVLNSTQFYCKFSMSNGWYVRQTEKLVE